MFHKEATFIKLGLEDSFIDSLEEARAEVIVNVKAVSTMIEAISFSVMI